MAKFGRILFESIIEGLDFLFQTAIENTVNDIQNRDNEIKELDEILRRCDTDNDED